VSYERKHNEANGEDNRDGTDDNRSWNCGVEGATEDKAVLDLRARQRRNFLATLFCSQGVPMLLAGDELGRSQQGNNNAYCQDNELSWIDWSGAGQDGLLEFTRALATLRREHPVFRRRRFFRGRDGGGHGPDIAWLTPAGREMTGHDWQTSYARAVAVFLNGDAITEPGPRGEPVRDDSFLLLLNAHHEPLSFTLPGRRFGRRWAVIADTAGDAAVGPAGPDGGDYRAAEVAELAGHSMMVLRRTVAARPRGGAGGSD